MQWRTFNWMAARTVPLVACLPGRKLKSAILLVQRHREKKLHRLEQALVKIVSHSEKKPQVVTADAGGWEAY
jgi:hypothetical protein